VGLLYGFVAYIYFVTAFTSGAMYCKEHS